MERFPTELRTPPLSPVLIVGCEELHLQLKAFFSQSLKPPVHVLLHNDTLSLDSFFGRKAENEDKEGLLKYSWVQRVRSKPVIVAVFITRSEFESDPWFVFAKKFESIKDLCEMHHCKLITIVVNDQREEFAAEIVTSFKLRFSIDDKSFCTLLAVQMESSDPDLIQLANNELKKIGLMFLENAWALHQAHIQRILLQSSQRVSPSITTTAWEAFKLGFLAEIRQEWSSAVSQYTASYQHLLEALRTRRFQNDFFVECLSVAEVLTMKICMLLMHQQRTDDAWQHFHFHLLKFKTAPDGLGVGTKAYFLGWLSQQYLIILDIIKNRNGDLQSLLGTSIVSNRHLINLYFHSAEAAVQQRRHVSFALTKAPMSTPAVTSSSHWGQFTCSLEELDDHLLAQEAQVDLQDKTVNLLETTLECVRKNNCVRREAHLSMMLAEERLAAGEVETARDLLLKGAGIYRKDGWIYLLAKALRLLIEISQEASWEKIVYSLELATLEDISKNEERKKFADSAIDSLLQTAQVQYENRSEIWVQEQDNAKDTVLFQGSLKDLSWSSILTITGDFENQENSQHGNLKFSACIKNKLPVDLPISGVSIHIKEQSRERRTLSLPQDSVHHLTSDECSSFALYFTPNLHGEVQVHSIELYFTPTSSLIWHLPTPLNAYVAYVGPPPLLKVTSPIEVYLGEEVAIQVDIECARECMVEKMVLDVTANVPKHEARWKMNGSNTFSIVDLQLKADEQWTEQYGLLHFRAPTKVMIRVSLKMNFEFSVVEQIEYEVKEAFHVENQIYSPFSTFHFLPSLEFATSSDVADPLSTKSPQRQTPAGTVKALPERKESLLMVGIKSKTECDILLEKCEWLCDPQAVVGIQKISGMRTTRMKENDVSTILLKIQTHEVCSKPVTLSLTLQWARVQKGDQMVKCGSKTELIEAKESSELVNQTCYQILEFCVRKPYLSTSFEPVSKVIAGHPFSYVLRIQNESDLPQELEMTLNEANGCLFCGDRATKRTIEPHEPCEILWKCVAYASGKVKLPKAQITSRKMKCTVHMDGAELFVKPSVLGTNHLSD